MPTNISRCLSGTDSFPLAQDFREHGSGKRREDLHCKLHSVGIGNRKTKTSAAMLKAALEKRKALSSMQVPGSVLSQPRWIGVHMKMDRVVKVMPTAMTNPKHTNRTMRVTRSRMMVR